MAVLIKNGKLLYHLTSLENLESIIVNGLLPRNLVQTFNDVADQEIIDYRASHGMNNYVPFHFFSRNPFDGRVQKDHPDKYFIYICITRDYALQNNFLIVPMHPIAMGQNLLLYNYNEGIAQIDWDTMELRDYTDRDCREICMAECLSQYPIPVTNFKFIYVPNQEVKDYVERLLAKIVGNYNLLVSVSNMFV